MTAEPDLVSEVTTAKRVRAEAKKARQSRLQTLDARARDLDSDVRRIFQLIGRLPADIRGDLRRRLGTVVAVHGLAPVEAAVPANSGQPSFAWFERGSPEDQDGPSLQGAWLALVGQLANLRSKELPPRLETLRQALRGEWRRRSEALHKPDGWFVWPATVASRGANALDHISAPNRGMLAALGYHVGVTSGLPEHVRRFVLDEVFAMELPLVHSEAYTVEWGVPRSPARLRKIAEAIAAFVRNAKRRRSAALSRACDDWERDLTYLHANYYVAHFDFDWPNRT